MVSNSRQKVHCVRRNISYIFNTNMRFKDVNEVLWGKEQNFRNHNEINVSHDINV